MRAFILTLIAIATLAAGCSGKARSPEGRWQGLYSGDGVMIAARVEIEKDGRVRLSAPNAFMDFAAMDEDQKADVQARLSSSLAAAWPAVKARELEFDGHTFRKPGGVAPQLEWDSATHHMTMYVYPGARATIRFDMEPVKDFN